MRDLPDELAEGDLVVVNDTRVVAGRLAVRRPGGGSGEVLLVERHEDGRWEALARPSRRLRPGMRLESPSNPVELLEALGDGRWLVRLEGEPAGEMPLPPYIHERLDDPERYQTVYADERRVGRGADGRPSPDPGAPRAARRRARHAARGPRHVPAARGGRRSRSTASTASATGSPPRRGDRILAAARVVAVGTTTVRVLETIARGGPLAGRTELFVTPGFEFRRVDALLTNFHLPRSTLLALVMAFAGVEETRALYRLAVAERYRFYSFGDAMLLL